MSEPDDRDGDLDSLFHALANRDRLQLLQVLRAHRADHGDADSSGMPINALAQEAELSRFSASRHLAILRRCGLVTADRVGLSALHSLAPDRFEVIEDWLYPFLDATSASTADPVSPAIPSASAG
ncbi:ArsR/SmtB family transcription factor [Microbacterium sp. PA5]|uniref:ArsR/SmtB family transcription factor n=1 Tax=Microbacterium sp. PA5 TaxID=3416654 RepID=UPI003CF24062